MTDKEFKRLSRPELLDIIYQLQLKQEELTAENRKLKKELEDKRIRMEQVGNIAEASLAIHNVFQSAQDAANRYLDEIRIMQEETKENCRRILEKAHKEADAIIAQADKRRNAYDSAVEAILKEYQ